MVNPAFDERGTLAKSRIYIFMVIDRCGAGSYHVGGSACDEVYDKPSHVASAGSTGNIWCTQRAKKIFKSSHCERWAPSFVEHLGSFYPLFSHISGRKSWILPIRVVKRGPVCSGQRTSI